MMHTLNYSNKRVLADSKSSSALARSLMTYFNPMLLSERIEVLFEFFRELRAFVVYEHHLFPME